MKCTVKQAKLIHKQIENAFDKLSEVLNEAHRRELIEYPDGTYKENAPCAALWECQNRYRKTTQEAFAEMFRRDAEGRK